MAKRASGPPPNPYLTSGAAADLSPANRIAYEVYAARRDLLPSIERIMNAGLSDTTTERALGLFRDSLADLDDPNRDPQVAIAAASAEDKA